MQDQIVQTVPRSRLVRHRFHRLPLLRSLLLLRLPLRKLLAGQVCEVVCGEFDENNKGTARRDEDSVVLADVHDEREAVEAVADKQTLLLAHAAIVETGNLRQTVALLFVV